MANALPCSPRHCFAGAALLFAGRIVARRPPSLFELRRVRQDGRSRHSRAPTERRWGAPYAGHSGPEIATVMENSHKSPSEKLQFHQFRRSFDVLAFLMKWPAVAIAKKGEDSFVVIEHAASCNSQANSVTDEPEVLLSLHGRKTVAF